MTEKQINSEIAKFCGWDDINADYGSGRRPKADYIGYEFVPDYCNDLNQMHEAEKSIFEHHPIWTAYYYAIGAGQYALHATARKKAEAFLKAIDKWIE
jgi:hypothetical protein